MIPIVPIVPGTIESIKTGPWFRSPADTKLGRPTLGRSGTLLHVRSLLTLEDGNKTTWLILMVNINGYCMVNDG